MILQLNALQLKTNKEGDCAYVPLATYGNNPSVFSIYEHLFNTFLIYLILY